MCVPMAASSLFRCPPMRPVRGKEQLGPCPGVIVHSSPSPTQMHHFYLIFFFLKEAGEGRGKAPEIPPPSAKKATSSPSPAAALTALTPFQARGQALSSV